jgi:predicted nucleotidyltransferase
MSRLKQILVRKEKRKARLLASLDSIVSELRRLGALKIILFGSLIEDNVDVGSDLDLFVLMPATRTGKEWMDLIYETVTREVAADIIVFNEREIREQLPTSSFLQNILKGRVMYEKTS